MSKPSMFSFSSLALHSLQVGILVSLVSVGGCRPKIDAVDKPDSIRPATRSVASTTASESISSRIEVTVDYGDGAARHFSAIPWKSETTAADSLDWIAQHGHGVSVRKQGVGKNTFVEQIDDLRNEGGGGKSWIFYVNDKLATEGCGAVMLQPGDHVLWRFEPYR